MFLFLNKGPADISGGGGAPVLLVYLFYAASQVGPVVQLAEVELEEVEVWQ